MNEKRRPERTSEKASRRAPEEQERSSAPSGEEEQPLPQFGEDPGTLDPDPDRT